MTSDTAIRFFKSIHRGIVGAEKLKIPNKFTRKYGGGLSNPIFLWPPDGTEWKVYWTKLDGEICLQDGWKEFASYYSLDHGHLVLFEYKESSHFEVHIFGMSFLEIEYSKHGIHVEKDNLDRDSDDSIEILDALPPCQKKNRLKSPMSSPQPRKKLRSGTTGDVEIRKLQPSNLSQYVHTRGAKKNQRALEEAKRFTSENPSFIVNLRPCYLGRGTSPNMPIVFARKYFEKMKQNVMIQFRKKLWPINLIRCESKHAAVLSAGWSLFAEESKLQAGDVCIFELINRDDAVLDVHIFRGHS